MNTTPPTACSAWRKLEAHAESWRGARLADLFASDPARARMLVAEAPGLRLDYSRQRLGALTLRLLAQLAAAPGRNASETSLGLLDAVRRHAAGAKQSDDITLVSVRLAP